jgi:sulfate permease, SulP family
MKHLFSNIKGDAFGGITAGIVALPLALAFGVSSGLGPSAGLYGAIFISFFAALFGGTSTQISGPTAPMTAVSMVVVAGIIATFNGDVSKAIPSILAVFLLAGIMQVGLGVIGLGKYIKYIPYPVVSGFMTAIGVIIIITQLLPMLGYYPKDDMTFVNSFKPQAEDVILEEILKDEADEGILVLEDFKETILRAEAISPKDILNKSKTLADKEASGVMGSVKMLPRALGNINWMELLLGMGTILIVFGFKRITTKIPSTLVALVIMTAVAIFTGIDYKPIPKIPQGLPEFNVSIFTEFNFVVIQPHILAALTLALLGAIDSLLTSVVADNMTKTKHKPNKELMGQGIGNTMAALFGGIPGAGATIRTVVNIKSGGKTKLSGMIAGVLLFVILLAIAPLASKIPSAVLAGILVTVGIGVMDYKGLKAIPYLPKDIKIGVLKMSSEVLIMMVVLLLATLWDLLYAVGIGLVISTFMFMKAIGDSTAEHSQVIPIEKAWKDEADFPKHLKEEVFIKHIKGPLFFGSTSEFQALSKQIPDTAKTVIIRLGRMPYMDQSGLYAMEEVLMALRNNNVTILFVNLMPQPRYMMERIDIIPGLVPENMLFSSFAESVKWVQLNVVDTH